MKSEEIVSSEDWITPAAIANSAASLIPSSAILVVVRSGILARVVPVARTLREVAVNQDIKALVAGKRVIPKFLQYFLAHAQPKLLGLVTRGATVHRLATESLKTLRTPVPPLPEQQRIVAILDEAFEGIATATSKAKKNLANARQLFQTELSTIFSNLGSAELHLLSEAVSKRIRHDRVGGWAAVPNHDSSRLQHTGRDLDVDPDHPAAA